MRSKSPRRINQTHSAAGAASGAKASTPPDGVTPDPPAMDGGGEMGVVEGFESASEEVEWEAGPNRL